MLRARRIGFTLIELLVVISIIALLIAILLPALNGARASARSVACLSNLKQIAIAQQTYENDHGHYTAARYSDPNPSFGVGDDAFGWRNRWEMQLQIHVWNQPKPNSGAGDQWDLGTRLSQSEPFACPEQEVISSLTRGYAHNAFDRLRQPFAGSFRPVTQLGLGGGPFYAPQIESLSDKHDPNDIIFIADANTNPDTGFSYWALRNGDDHWYGLPPTAPAAAYSGFRHPNQTKNTLFLDLHAGPVQVDTPVAFEIAVIE